MGRWVAFVIVLSTCVANAELSRREIEKMGDEFATIGKELAQESEQVVARKFQSRLDYFAAQKKLDAGNKSKLNESLAGYLLARTGLIQASSGMAEQLSHAISEARARYQSATSDEVRATIRADLRPAYTVCMESLSKVQDEFGKAYLSESIKLKNKPMAHEDSPFDDLRRGLMDNIEVFGEICNQLKVDL